MTKHDVIVPKALMKEAEKVDRELRATWVERCTHEKAVIKIDVKLGRLWNVVQARGLHKYVRKAGSRKGFASLDEYAHSITGQARSSFFLAKTMAGLTEGSNPILAETVAEIGPRKSAILAKIPEERRTPQLVEKAKNESVEDFTRTAQSAVNENQPAGKQVVMRVEFFRRLHPTVSDKLEGTIELYTQLKAVRQTDPSGTLTLQEKAILIMCSIAETWAQGEECAVKEQSIDLGEPQTQETVAADSTEEETDVEEADPFATEAELNESEAEAERSIHVLPAFDA